jgi:hypothetical protein
MKDLKQLRQALVLAREQSLDLLSDSTPSVDDLIIPEVKQLVEEHIQSALRLDMDIEGILGGLVAASELEADLASRKTFLRSYK